MAEQRAEVDVGMIIEWDVPIEMDDGAVLRADVFRPIGDGAYPTIMTLGPYGKNLPFQQGWAWQWEHLTTNWPEVMEGTSNRYAVWETVDPEKWVPDGYVCLRVDARGSGRSPGYLDLFSPREARDYYECIEWAATQSWSNGRVGLNGVSYYAMNQWRVASLQPPHLTAMCVWEGAADWYRDANYHGGILSRFWPWIANKQIWRVQHGLGERGPMNQFTGELVCGPVTLDEDELRRNRCDLEGDLKAHPLRDQYHRDRSPDWDRVVTPLLSAASWGGHGLHPRGNFEGFTRSRSAEKWLECHGLEHWTHFYTDYGLELQKRFFGHFLKDDVASTWSDQPTVRVQVRHVDGEFVERDESTWPLASTRWERWYLDGGEMALRPDPGCNRVASYRALEGG